MHSKQPQLHQLRSIARRAAAPAIAALWLLAAASAPAQQAAGSADSAPSGAASRASDTAYAAGPVYSPVPAISPAQVQIVFFRPAGSTPVTRAQGNAAHVYVDREFHTALAPNSYTTLCVPAGSHTLEAYIGDAPVFPGKITPKTRATLDGGKTYFVGVSESGSGEPMPYARADAERLLAGAREQRHFPSRASTVVACEPDNRPPAPQKVRYTLNTDVLFIFDKSDLQSITPEGHRELRKVAQQIREYSPASVSRIMVRGHADPIGTAAYNQTLSEQRARTIARALGQEGLPSELIRSEALGSREPVVSCPVGRDKAARIACNQPNRRVEVVLEGLK